MEVRSEKVRTTVRKKAESERIITKISSTRQGQGT